MIKILFCGINGRMGKNTLETIAQSAAFSEKFKVYAGVDITPDQNAMIPVYSDIYKVPEKPDVIVDFSHHSALPSILGYAEQKRVPAVICTTGHSPEELELLKEAARKIPVFYSGNMSIGINLLTYLTRKVASILGEDFDIEIVEAHHNKKLDAPSGTALMLANAASKGVPYNAEYVYDRHSYRKQRSKEEIGIHSIRAGTIVGEHCVIFAGSNETLTLSHSASSRAAFATGALRASEYILGKPAGMYDMNDVLEMFDI